jgi:hypothetical protein
MIRKTMHLVRDTIRCDSLTAVVESSKEQIIESVEPEELWFLLTKQGARSEPPDETDTGIDMFFGKYDPSKHSHLPVIELPALDASSSVSRTPDAPEPLSEDEATVPGKRRNTVRYVVTLERSVEQYQVKRAVVIASTVEELEALDGEQIWWKCPKIEGEGEVDEQYMPDISIEMEPYEADRHEHLPFVLLQGPIVSDEMSPPPAFLLRWQPSVTADEKDKTESDRVVRIVGSERNQCYWNARKVIRSLPDYSDATYVEGFVVTHDGAIFEHGWIIKDGKIVDPTIPQETTYFPGLEFRGRQQIREFLQTDWGSRFHGRPFHRAFGDFGFESPSFVQAFQQARQCLLSTFGVRAMEAAAVVRAEHGLPWPDDWR